MNRLIERTLMVYLRVLMLWSAGVLMLYAAEWDAEKTSIHDGIFSPLEITFALHDMPPPPVLVRYAGENVLVLHIPNADQPLPPSFFKMRGFPSADLEGAQQKQTDRGLWLFLPMKRPYALAKAFYQDGSSTLEFNEISQKAYAQLVQNLPADPGIFPKIAPSTEKTATKELPVIVLDPGHGGNDPGAVRNQIRESDVALKMALILREHIQKSGRYTVLMTRETDVFVELAYRRDFSESQDADLFVSIHADVVPQSEVSGAAIYTLSHEAGNARIARLVAFENQTPNKVPFYLETDIETLLLDMERAQTVVHAKSFAQKLGKAWQELPYQPYGLTHSTLSWDQADFAVLKSVSTPSLLLELGYLSNTQDQKKIEDPAWQRAMAQAFLVGLDQMFYTK